MADPTAKTFVTPLLVAIGEATNRIAGIEVSTDDVVGVVCDAMHIREGEYGNDPAGRPKVRMWILQAFNKKLKPDGLADAPSKGKWTLTPKGQAVVEAIYKGQQPLVEDEIEDEDTEEVPIGAPVASVTPLFEGGDGVSWAIPSVEDTYNEDPYIRGLAVAATACFGSWTEGDATCAKCPIAQTCMNRAMTFLPGIAASVMAKLLKPPKATLPAAATIIDDPGIDEIISMIEEGDAAKAPAKPPPPKYTSSKASAEVLCQHCNKPIRLNEQMYWVRAADNGADVGVYHPACYDAKFKG